MQDVLTILAIIIGTTIFLGSMPALIFLVDYSDEVSDKKDFLYFKRQKKVRKTLKKKGYENVESFLHSLFDTTPKDWQPKEKKLIYHPFSNQPNLSFQLERTEHSSKILFLSLKYKERELLSYHYDENDDVLKHMYYTSDELKLSDSNIFKSKGRQIFKHLLPILKAFEQQQEEAKKREERLENEKIAKAESSFAKSAIEKEKALRKLLKTLSQEEPKKQDDFSVTLDGFAVRFSSYGMARFATFYLNKEPFVNVAYENDTCKVECLNQDNKWFVIFERMLPTIQSACLERFRLAEVPFSQQIKRLNSPLVWSKYKELESLLEKLQTEEKWLETEDHHLVANVYPSDISVIMDTYSELDSPLDMEENVLNSLQNIHQELIRIAGKTEDSKKYVLEKQNRLTRVRQT